MVSTPSPSPAERLLGGPLPAILILLALIAGAAGLVLTPREEEPQIVVPVADVLVSAPGLSAEQVERQVATPLERLLFQIHGVEHVYSTSQAGRAVVTVRFHVGEDREDALLEVHSKIQSGRDQVPAAVHDWVVRPVEVDDVPVLVAALWSDDASVVGDFELRRLAEEVELALQGVEEAGPVRIAGGRPREIRVEVEPEALAARRTTLLDLERALQVSNVRIAGGALVSGDRVTLVETGDFVADARELGRLVVNVVDGLPVYLADVARIADGPAEPAAYTWMAFGPADPETAARAPGERPAVFVSVAKQRGSNAVRVAADAREVLARLEREVFPPQVHVRVVRDQGATADEKVDDLVASLGVAMLTVVVFIGIFLGWRAALVVGLAIPVCYGVTLALDLFAGYTVNRVTLFALILSLGLLVDDPITGIDNIDRFLRRGGGRRLRTVIDAMVEIRGALVMSTIAIVLSFAPMFYITGMMGPYMAPMAFNVPVTVIASTIVAFLVTPWLAARLLRAKPGAADEAAGSQPSRTYRLYERLLGAVLRTRGRAFGFLALVGVVFLAACLLPALRLVPLKLLPHDNKSEFQVVVDMPEGTTLERTADALRALAGHLVTVPEVRDVSVFAGVPSPIDFNAMVRRYYFRERPHEGDLRINLAHRLERSAQSYSIMLRERAALTRIAAEHGARISIVEAPPGPPVLATVTAEVHGASDTPYPRLRAAALDLAARLSAEPYVVDVDTSVEDAQDKLRFVTDKEKAALSGISTADVARTVSIAAGGLVVGHLEHPSEAQPLPIVLRLPVERRASQTELEALHVKGQPGITKIRERAGVRDAPQPLVQLAELGRFEARIEDRAIHRKDLERVVYVTADTAGRPPADVIVDVGVDLGRSEADAPRGADERTHLSPGGGIGWNLPSGVDVKWNGEGEWQITLRVFRDLGLAFAAALVGIFLVLLVQTGLATLAGIIMLAIPLTTIGIMPGFWLLNQIGERTIDGLPNPVLFTATAMIGMIALAGIVVRNSLILVEFVHLRLRAGAELTAALIDAGATRMRPIFLTAATTALGNLVITLDPIFSGLAWSIIFGIAASTVFTLVVIPVVYHLVYANRPGHGLPDRVPAGD